MVAQTKTRGIEIIWKPLCYGNDSIFFLNVIPALYFIGFFSGYFST